MFYEFNKFIVFFSAGRGTENRGKERGEKGREKRGEKRREKSWEKGRKERGKEGRNHCKGSVIVYIRT